MSQTPMYPPGYYGETNYLTSQMPGQDTTTTTTTYPTQPQWNWGNTTMPTQNPPNYDFSSSVDFGSFLGGSPSAWNGAQSQINQWYSNQGNPVNVTPAWQAAQQVANNALRDTLANANEQYSMGRQRFSTGAASSFSQAAEDAGAQLAAQRLAMELQSQEAARQRQMQALGYGMDLGNQQANYQLGQGNLALGASAQEMQNAQNQWNNQMGLLNSMMGYGSMMQGYGQSALDRIYQDWGAANSMPYLNAALQFAQAYPPGAVVQQQSPLGGILGGLGALIPGVGGLIAGLGGAAAGAMGGGGSSYTPTAGGTYTGPSYGGFTPNFYFGQGYRY